MGLKVENDDQLTMKIMVSITAPQLECSTKPIMATNVITCRRKNTNTSLKNMNMRNMVTTNMKSLNTIIVLITDTNANLIDVINKGMRTILTIGDTEKATKITIMGMTVLLTITDISNPLRTITLMKDLRPTMVTLTTNTNPLHILTLITTKSRTTKSILDTNGVVLLLVFTDNTTICN